MTRRRLQGAIRSVLRVVRGSHTAIAGEDFLECLFVLAVMGATEWNELVLHVVLLEDLVGGTGEIVHERLERNLNNVVEPADLLVEGVHRGSRVE